MPANFLDVPPELCAIIAHFASRQSLAVLCSVSRRLCSVFSSLLYANTIDPPLESAQFSQLMKTLSNPQTLNWKHHPAVFIRHLRLTDCGGRRLTNVESQAELSFDVLRNTYRLIPRSEHFTGSALRSLHWNLAAGLDELEQIIGAPGQFPNLKKLVVSCNGQGSDFSFIQIRGLEVLDLEIFLPTESSFDSGNKPCYRFAEAIQILPISSPLLHTLQLKLKMSFNLYTFPFLERDTLLGAMNLIHFPFLTTLCLSVDFYPDEDDIDEDRLPTMDFSPFLAAHPTLVALSLSAHGTRLTQDAAFLPRVRSFKGSFEDSAVICAHPTRHLDQLVLTLLHKSHFEPPSFYTDPLPVQTSLSKLQVLAVDAGGSAVKMTNELSPASLVHLVKSFPNLLHVDICIVGNLSRYRNSLIRLTKLQSLRIQVYRTCSAPRTRPLTTIFPPTDYAQEFDRLLPFLPHLLDIELCVLADNDEWGDDSEDSCPCCRGCGSPGRDFELMFSPPEMQVDYRYSVMRTSSKPLVVLADVHISDKRYPSL